MKSFIFTFIMILGFSTVEVFADDKDTLELEMNLSVDKYTSIEMKDLPENVQDVLAMDYTCYSVSSVDAKSLGKGEILFKVTLLDQENLETMILLSDEGKVVE